MKIKLRPRCYFDINIGHSPAGRIIFELYNDLCPKTVDNFLKLCTGECGIGKTTQSKLHYLNTNFHRVIKGFMIQGGDFSSGDGKGGESIYGDRFEDENLDTLHDRPFLLSMANCGPNTNGSQFFITTKPTPHLNKKHVVFGHVVSGENLIESIENLPVNTDNRPVVDATIANCGELIPVRKKVIKGKEASIESTSSKGKKSKKSKKRKHKNKKKSKKVIADGVEEINPNCSVRPDEIPEVPKPFFLYRGSLKDDMKVKEIENDTKETNNQSSKYVSKDTVGRSGRIIKGRGQLRYMSRSPHGRSETPPHWKKESQPENSTIDFKDNRWKENEHSRKRKRSPSVSSNEKKKDRYEKMEKHPKHGKDIEIMRTKDDNNLHDCKKRKRGDDVKADSPNDTRKRNEVIENTSYERRKRDENVRNRSDDSRRKRNGSDDSRKNRNVNRRNSSADSLKKQKNVDHRQRKNSNKKSFTPDEIDQQEDYKRYNRAEKNTTKESNARYVSPNERRGNKERIEESQGAIKKTETLQKVDNIVNLATREKMDRNVNLKSKDMYPSVEDKTARVKHEKQINKKVDKNPDFDRHEKIIYDYGEESDDSMIPRKNDKRLELKNVCLPKDPPNEIAKEVVKESTKDVPRENKPKDEVSRIEPAPMINKTKEHPRRSSSSGSSVSKSPVRDRRDTKSPPAYLVAKWQDRRDKIMVRRSPVARTNERPRHSPQRSSRYSISPSKPSAHRSPNRETRKSSKNDKFSNEKCKRNLTSSGTIDSSPSSDGSSVIDNNNRQSLNTAVVNSTTNTTANLQASPIKKEDGKKMAEKCKEAIADSEHKPSSGEGKDKSLETVMVIKSQEKPRLLNQWNTEEGVTSENKDKQQSSVLAKLRENEIAKPKQIISTNQKTESNTASKTMKEEIIKKRSPVSQSISKYRSRSGSRSHGGDKRSSYSSSSVSSSSSSPVSDRRSHGRVRSDSRRHDRRARPRYRRDSRSRSPAPAISRRRYRSRSRRSYSSYSDASDSRSRSRSRSAARYRRDSRRRTSYRGTGGHRSPVTSRARR